MLLTATIDSSPLSDVTNGTVGIPMMRHDTRQGVITKTQDGSEDLSLSVMWNIDNTVIGIASKYGS
jgi:hypothetical protein